jgi:hypothetical protein
MKAKITEAIVAVEAALIELQEAIKKSGEDKNRMAQRNFEYRVEEYVRLIRELKACEEYLLQPKFIKYFLTNID